MNDLMTGVAILGDGYQVMINKIASLESQVEALKAENVRLQAKVITNVKFVAIEELHAKVVALESVLGEAEKALEFYGDENNYLWAGSLKAKPDGCISGCIGDAEMGCGEEAREALTVIRKTKGEG